MRTFHRQSERSSRRDSSSAIFQIRYLPAKSISNSAACDTFKSGPQKKDNSDVPMRVRVDWRPQVSLKQDLVCLTTAGAACTALYLAAPPPPSISIRYALSIASAFAALLFALRSALIDQHYAEAAVSERSLGDDRSEFADLMGLTLHYRVSDKQQCSYPTLNEAPTGGDPLHQNNNSETMWAMHCYHGFGATAFTFDDVLNRLSRGLSSQELQGESAAHGSRGAALVTVHDTPGFGLTTRPKQLKSYSLSFNGNLGRVLQDKAIFERTSQGDVGSESGQCRQTLKATPLIRRALLGHSVGSISAALQVIEGPQDVELLVLVAPAILVWPGSLSNSTCGTTLREVTPFDSCKTDSMEDNTNSPGRAAEGSVTRRHYILVDSSREVGLQDSSPADPSSSINDTAKLSSDPSRTALVNSATYLDPDLPSNHQEDSSSILSCLLATCNASALLGLQLLLRVFRLLIITVLRGLVRSRGFWERGLQAAFFDKACVTGKAIDDYRIPQLIKGWELGLCRFIEARVAHVSWSDLWSFWRARLKNKPVQISSLKPEETNLGARLAQAIQHRRSSRLPLRVLIIHGRNDLLVPVSNSERLARLLPPGCGCELVVMERCGHVPHEERPEELAEIISIFADQC